MSKPAHMSQKDYDAALQLMNELDNNTLAKIDAAMLPSQMTPQEYEEYRREYWQANGRAGGDKFAMVLYSILAFGLGIGAYGLYNSDRMVLAVVAGSLAAMFACWTVSIFVKTS